MECAAYCTNAHAHAQTHTPLTNNTHIPLHNTSKKAKSVIIYYKSNCEVMRECVSE